MNVSSCVIFGTQKTAETILTSNASYKIVTLTFVAENEQIYDNTVSIYNGKLELQDVAMTEEDTEVLNAFLTNPKTVDAGGIIAYDKTNNSITFIIYNGSLNYLIGKQIQFKVMDGTIKSFNITAQSLQGLLAGSNINLT